MQNRAKSKSASSLIVEGDIAEIPQDTQGETKENMLSEVNSTLGREIRQARQHAEFKLRSSGKYGILSFIFSFVEEGEGIDFCIENAAVRICGENFRKAVYSAVLEGMNRYWIREDGHLALMNGRSGAAL